MKPLKLVFIIIFIGNVSFAQKKIADSLLIVLASNKEDTNKVNTLRMLCGAFRNIDPVQAIIYGKEAVELGKKLNFYKGVAGAYLNLGSNYSTLNKLDSTKLYLDSSLYHARVFGEPNRLALIYLNMGDLQLQLQNLEQALIYCDSSLVYAEKANNDDRRARVYQTIGSVYYKQDRYDESIPYYEKAISYYRKLNKHEMVAIILNNIGNIYKNTGKLNESISNYKRAIAISDSAQETTNLSLFYGNLADAYFLSKNYPSATDAASNALKFAEIHKNAFHTSVSHSHFAEIYLAQMKYDEAIRSASAAYEISTQLEDIDLQQKNADLLAEVYFKAGRPGEAYKFLRISKSLSDSVLTLRFGEDIAAMQTAFKVDEKDKEIELLNQESKLKQAEIREQRTLLITSAIVALLALIGIWLLINRNKLRQRMKELEIRNRIAADLHDDVGSSLSSIHVLSHVAAKSEGEENVNTLNKITISAKETMERMSDIVWAIHPGNDTIEQLVFRMKEFVSDILDPLDVKYEFIVDKELDAMRLGINQRRDVFLIFKEAINNIAKYSKSKNVNIRFSQSSSGLILKIKDDGVGFNCENTFSGNGLNNMRQRAKQLGGSLEINSKENEGCTIIFSIKA